MGVRACVIVLLAACAMAADPCDSTAPPEPTNPCDTTAAPAPSPSPAPTPGNSTGKEACQGHSYDKAACAAVGCCRWNILLGCRANDADAQCYSENPCDTTVAPGPSPPGPGKKSRWRSDCRGRNRWRHRCRHDGQ